VQSSEERTVALTRFFSRTLPSSIRTFLLIIVFSFLIGIISSFISLGNFYKAFAYGSAEGIFLIGVPAVISGAVTTVIRRDLKLRKMLFISLVSSFIYSLFYILANFLGASKIMAVDSFSLILIGNAFVFAIWFAVAKIVLRLRLASFFFGAIQPTLNILFYVSYGPILLKAAPEVALMKLYSASAIFLTAIYVMFWLINAPMKRNFGVSSVDAISLFLAQWFDRSKKLEDVLENLGCEIDTLIGILAFRAKNKLKCIFLVPYVHYGPLGNLGGSEFPYLMAREMKEKFDAETFVFHGTTTNDFNPVSSSEIEKFLKESTDAVENLKFKKANGLLSIGKHGGCKAETIVINKKGFVILTRAPRTTEDIDFSLGLAIRNQAIASGLEEAIVVDAHNAETGEITRVDSGNPIGFEYLEAVKQSVENIGKGEVVKLGISQDLLREFWFKGGVGRNGVKTAVFQFKNKKYAMLLIDGNGITPSFRKEIITSARNLGVDECEVLTTDSHSVNMVAGVINPVGGHGRRELLERMEKTVVDAMKNVEEVEVGVDVRKVNKVKVLGVRQSYEFVGTVNSVVAIMRILAPLVLIGAVLFALWVMAKI
jgi:putative membrane protein